jgi:hypothetical protein
VWKGYNSSVMVTAVRGIVRQNRVVLPEGTLLPDGAEVEVRLLTANDERENVFSRVRANRLHRVVGMDQILEEDKQDRDEDTRG